MLYPLTIYIQISPYRYEQMNITGNPPKQCPVDFPYAFQHGRSCCSYDEDIVGNSISFRSTTCLRGSYRPCTSGRCLDNGNISYDRICSDRC